MFKLTDQVEVWWPVVIPVPTNGGKIAEHQIEVRFRIGDPSVEKSETDALIDAANGTTDNQVDFLKDRVVNLSRVTDEAGAELPFSDELLKRVLAIPYARQAIFQAYTGAALGRAAVRKN